MPTDFVIHDADFAHVAGRRPRLWRLADAPAHEGPVASGPWLFATSLPDAAGSTILRVDVRTGAWTALHTRAVRPNGMTMDHGGRLVVCEQGDGDRPAVISRVDPVTLEREVLVDRVDGRPLNSPNDVVVGPDGAIWFTDPAYGWLQGFRPEPRSPEAIVRWDPETGEASVAATCFDKPNGVALSPDGATLYATDSGANQAPGSFDPGRAHHVVAFGVDGARLTDRRLFAVTEPGIPDGLKTDAAGRVYVSTDDGVLVLAPDGRRLGEIVVPGAVNFCFGGTERSRLYVTADHAIWVAELAAAGAPVPVSPRPGPAGLRPTTGVTS